MAEVKTGLEGVLKIVHGQTGSAAAQAGSTIGYVQGFSYDYSENPVHVFDGSAYKHSKKQRRGGNATISTAFVNNDVYNVLGSSTASETYARHYIELQVDGISGTCEDVYAFRDCVLENMSRDVPEEGIVTEEWGFKFDYYEHRAAADALIT